MGNPARKDQAGAPGTGLAVSRPGEPAVPQPGQLLGKGYSERLSRRIADSTADAWYGQHVSGAEPVALGVVAVLAMHGLAAPKEATQWWINASDAKIACALKNLWTHFQIMYPDLARLAGPFAEWLYEEPVREDWARAAAAAARASAGAGLLRMGRRALNETDVIGTVYLNMRGDKARKARGEYYTPPGVCELLAGIQAGDQPLEPGMRIDDPCAGTGGMFRGLATVMRSRGLNPADFLWTGNDVSPVSVAGLACNSYLWGLGPSVLYGVADTLADPGWQKDAAESALAVFAKRDEAFRDVRRLGIIRGLDPGPGPAALPSPGLAAEAPGAADPAPGGRAAIRPPDIVLDGSPAAQMALFGDESPLGPKRSRPGQARRARGASGPARKR